MEEDTTNRAADVLRRRQMALPALLFVAGHRPLAFILGHLLLVMHPVTALLGADWAGEWGNLLTRPAVGAKLADLLAGSLDGETPAGEAEENGK